MGESTVVADPILGESFFSGRSGHLGVREENLYFAKLF